MNDSYKINPNSTIHVARDLTFKAIENGMISISTDSKETAQNVLDFYHTIIEHIND